MLRVPKRTKKPIVAESGAGVNVVVDAFVVCAKKHKYKENPTITLGTWAGGGQAKAEVRCH